MSMSDPIADMFTRIRNAQRVDKQSVSMPSSKLKVAIARLLQDEGYIDGFEVVANGVKAELTVRLKYYAGRPVIDRLQSEVQRVYRLPEVQERLKTLGLEAILSSPEELARYQASEIAKWAKVVKDSGARAE
ncbi:MAG: 30S ribosomal protein S8 [Betaproteobacteria bacterium]|nr:30S ribosomal protein S8 [Betaproteobacteria bacterium]